jgi:hypothetical protein
MPGRTVNPADQAESEAYWQQQQEQKGIENYDTVN